MNLLFVLNGFIGGNEWIIILIAILVLFGGRKIPELMKGIGKGMKEFKKATKDGENTTEEKKEEPIEK